MTRGLTYRVIYTARIEDAVYVLHAFKKKTEQTAKADIGAAKNRLKDVRALEAMKAKAAKEARKGKK
jgi:phage-related protein